MEWVQQYWMELIFTAIVSLFIASVKYMYRAITAVKGGMQAILRDEIIDLYNKCHDSDCVKIYELENMEHLYKNYVALGGNGAIKELYKDFKTLPMHKRTENKDS